jgi:hypothetical protein
VRRVTYEGRAQPGDTFRTPWGEWRTIVSATSAGMWITAKVEQDIQDYHGTPNFMRDSIAGLCCLFAPQTTGREKRNLERAKARNSKPIRRVTVSDGQ